MLQGAHPPPASSREFRSRNLRPPEGGGTTLSLRLARRRRDGRGPTGKDLLPCGLEAAVDTVDAFPDYLFILKVTFFFNIPKEGRGGETKAPPL